MTNLLLQRIYLKPRYTIGHLTVDGVYLCDTLEDTVRDVNADGDIDDPGEEKILGETAIPYGRYRIEVTYSPKFKRLLPLLLNVWGFIGVRIHRGRYPWNTAGCILVGENKIKGGLINTAFHEERLTKILHRYQIDGNEIFINIL